MPVFRSPVLGISISEALAEAYSSAPDSEVIVDTLEFKHVAFKDSEGNPFYPRVVNAHKPLSATLEPSAPVNASEEVVFEKCYFSLTLPELSDSDKLPEISILVSNIAKNLSPYLARAKEIRAPLYVTWRRYLMSDLTRPHIDPPLTFVVTSISSNLSDVTASAGFFDLSNLRFPSKLYTSDEHPMLNVR